MQHVIEEISKKIKAKVKRFFFNLYPRSILVSGIYVVPFVGNAYFIQQFNTPIFFFVFQGSLECDSRTVFQLAAHVLQVRSS